MAIATKSKMDTMSIFDLYKHYAALESSFPLLTPESKELVATELEQCASLRSEKVDRLYYAWAHHEDSIERAKKEQKLLLDQKKFHESQVSQIKTLIKWLRTHLPKDEATIKGRNYQFTLRRMPDFKVHVESSIDEWTAEERQAYCVVQTITTTQHSVVTLLSGEVLDESTKPVTKSEIIPNVDAICNAYKEGQKLPHGVKVFQDYAITRKRLLSSKQETGEQLGTVGVFAPEYPIELLPEPPGANE